MRYRSLIVIRLNGRKNTETFLFVRDVHKNWQPATLPDGTISDGKTRTYTRCVEHLLGSVDTFFTSVFSAQGKRQLSAYLARRSQVETGKGEQREGVDILVHDGETGQGKRVKQMSGGEHAGASIP